MVPRRRSLAATALVLLASTATAQADGVDRARFDARATAFAAAAPSTPCARGAPPGRPAPDLPLRPDEDPAGPERHQLDIQRERPAVDGWIVGFRPGLVYAKGGRSPSVQVVHLHHAVWLVGDS